jgi:hypothetical protein
MKIKLEKQVTTTEEVEIESPAYFKNYLGQYFLINDKALIKISNGLIFIVPAKDFERDSDFKDVMSGKYDIERVSESEFNDAYQSFIERCNSMVYAPAEI